MRAGVPGRDAMRSPTAATVSGPLDAPYIVRLQSAVDRACAEIDHLREMRDELVAALKDLRDLSAAAFRVIAAANLDDALIREVDRTGQHVVGAGARAIAAIRKVEDHR